ncbi:hypothetical protein [Eisenbergiella sp.]
MDKIGMIVKFNNITLEYLSRIDNALSEETKAFINSLNLDFRIYADAFQESFEADDFDVAVMEKLKDTNYVCERMAYYSKD